MRNNTRHKSTTLAGANLDCLRSPNRPLFAGQVPHRIKRCDAASELVGKQLGRAAAQHGGGAIVRMSRQQFVQRGLGFGKSMLFKFLQRLGVAAGGVLPGGVGMRA